jgi:hypothetical protein
VRYLRRLPPPTDVPYSAAFARRIACKLLAPGRSLIVAGPMGSGMTDAAFLLAEHVHAVDAAHRPLYTNASGPSDRGDWIRPIGSVSDILTKCFFPGQGAGPPIFLLDSYAERAIRSLRGGRPAIAPQLVEIGAATGATFVFTGHDKGHGQDGFVPGVHAIFQKIDRTSALVIERDVPPLKVRGIPATGIPFYSNVSPFLLFDADPAVVLDGVQAALLKITGAPP